MPFIIAHYFIVGTLTILIYITSVIHFSIGSLLDMRFASYPVWQSLAVRRYCALAWIPVCQVGRHNYCVVVLLAVLLQIVPALHPGPQTPHITKLRSRSA